MWYSPDENIYSFSKVITIINIYFENNVFNGFIFIYLYLCMSLCTLACMHSNTHGDQKRVSLGYLESFVSLDYVRPSLK